MMNIDLRRKEFKQNLTLSLVTFFLLLLALEILVRLFIIPAPNAYGTLFGLELAPFRLKSPTTPPPPSDRSAVYKNLVVNGQRITKGDLWGFSRKDPVLGYAPQENVISVNGWWQINSFGARARYDTAPDIPAGQQRMLVFGDSFAVGSRVPFEEVWSTILDAASENLEVVNFGVDGYGMGQSFLRYQEMKNRVDYDVVLIMYVPTADWWRDINTRRDLGGSWEMYWVMPRYIVEQDELRLVSSPFETGSDRYDKNSIVMMKELRTHLRTYDRFYFRTKFEEPWFIGKSVFYKLFARAYYIYQLERLTNGYLNPGSEVLQVSKKIFEAMNNEVKRDGKEFVLIFLPGHQDLRLIEENAAFRDNWENMVSSTCASGLDCIDLARDLRQIPASELDRGYDGTHYGPKANQLIAEFIRKHLEHKGMLERFSR